MAVLDELTAGLDPQARRDTWALIEGVRASGVTVLLVTHFMEEAERLCDRVALIDAGRSSRWNAVGARGGRRRRDAHPVPPVPGIDDELLTGLAEVTTSLAGATWWR